MNKDTSNREVVDVLKSTKSAVEDVRYILGYIGAGLFIFLLVLIGLVLR